MQFSGAGSPPGRAGHAHDHLVEFYETQASLVDTVADFVVGALRTDDSAIVVATPAHRDAFGAAIRAGVDLDAAVREGRYHALDAADLLSAFMVDGAPDPARFREVVTSVLDIAADGGRDVRIYGEMVALLWADGDVGSTMALEDLWNELAAVRSFSLLCGYPRQGFDVQSRETFNTICRHHSGVISAQGYRSHQH